jgi:hypothetical protein
VCEMNSDLHAPFGGLARLSHTIEVFLQLSSQCKLRLKNRDQFEWSGKKHTSKIWAKEISFSNTSYD